MATSLTGLVGDVGGTNARFALAHVRAGAITVDEPKALPAKDYPKAEDAVRAFLASDPETALRLLTGRHSTVHRGTVRTLEQIIDAERVGGTFDPSLDTATLAYAILRISEGFLYADVVAARSVDIDRAVTVIDALLSGLDRAPAPASRC